MKRRIVTGVLAGLVIAGFGLVLPGTGSAGVDISISIPLPGIVISGPPALVVIPGTQVYYLSDIEPEVFFYAGTWYRPHLGRWYIAASYRGPWYYLAAERVPVAVAGRPAGYRHSHVRHGQAIPRDAVQERRAWDRGRDRYDRRWDDDDHGRTKDNRFDRGEGRGRGSRWDD
jgi:hypothetical protein